jgi:chemotaxis methyl-accepting protein methylase
MEAAIPTSTPGVAGTSEIRDRPHDRERRDASTAARDGRVLEQVERLLPALLADGRLVTVWAAGCDDGWELCRLATLLEGRGALARALLLGTDAGELTVAAARRGDAAASAAREVHARIRWEQRDVLNEGAPRGGWLLVICRERTCEESAAARRTVHATLATSLARGGLLVLGCGEAPDALAALGLERLAENVYRRS